MLEGEADTALTHSTHPPPRTEPSLFRNLSSWSDLCGNKKQPNGCPDGSDGKESTCNAGDLGSIPGLGRTPWRRERLPTPVFWPGEFHGLCSPRGCKEQLSLKLKRESGEAIKSALAVAREAAANTCLWQRL